MAQAAPWCSSLLPAHVLQTHGPDSYPAGHIGIHRILAVVLNATSLRSIQYIYAALYITSLFLSCLIYHRARGIPNWVILLLPLSKRLHSIYVLRLFNDCWSSTIVLAAVYAYSFVGSETLACFLFRYGNPQCDTSTF
jgi:alpha-1,3-mannosyltransferase